MTRVRMITPHLLYDRAMRAQATLGRAPILRSGPLKDRLLIRMIYEGNGCITLLGSVHHSGYNHIRVDGQKRQAHRVAYETWIGPIPDGLDLDHLCRHRACVNPLHLEPVTRKVNVLRGVGRGAKNAAKNACPKGHSYDRLNAKGARRCSICDRLGRQRSSAPRS